LLGSDDAACKWRRGDAAVTEFAAFGGSESA